MLTGLAHDAVKAQLSKIEVSPRLVFTPGPSEDEDIRFCYSKVSRETRLSLDHVARVG